MGRLANCVLLACLLLHGRAYAQQTEAEAWRAACAELPELGSYRPLFLEPRPFDELMAWVPEGKTIRVYDENCKPIDLVRHEGHLAGDMEEKTTFHKGLKRISARTAHFGLDVSYTGPGWTDYERDEEGRWQEVGGGGMGCFEIRAGTLGRVTREAAFYNGTLVTFEVVCWSQLEELGKCADGSPRKCQRCEGIRLDAKSNSPGRMIRYRGPMVRQSSSKPVDCSRPCPADELGARVERLNRYLDGKRFISTDEFDSGAALFRSRKACRRHRARSRERGSGESGR